MEVFDLRLWLSSANVSAADKSLNDEAARLLVLNDSLIDEASGPILASLIVSAEGTHGLEIFEDLARGTEPRFVGMALLNILYTFRGDRSKNCEFSYCPGGADAFREITISGSDLPSEEHTRERVATIMPGISSVFLEKVSEGDFCPDFLTYLLTILMDLSKDLEKSALIAFHLAKIPSARFLKAIIRTWKDSELSDHTSTVENIDADSGLSLGFLVSCYLRYMCSTAQLSYTDHFPRNELDGDLDQEQASSEKYGIEALISLHDWFIKFAMMRLYQCPSISAEREHLITVLHECATHHPPFGYELLRLHFGPSVLHCLKHINEILQSLEHPIPIPTCSRYSGILWQYFHTVLHFSSLLDITTSSNQADETLHHARKLWFATFWQSITILSTASLTLLMRSDFEKPISSTLFLKKSLSSLLLRTNVFALAVRNMYISTSTSRARRNRINRWVESWIRHIYTAINTHCARIGSTWEQIAARRDLSAVRSSLIICNIVASKEQEQTRHTTYDRSTRCVGHVCDWCFEELGNAKACGRCEKSWYCSGEHQRLHWKAGHRTECAFRRGVLEGCAISLEKDGRICGLVGEEVVGGQSREALCLGFRMPGVFYVEGDAVGVRYLSRGEAWELLNEDSEAGEQRWVLRKCLEDCGSDVLVVLVDTQAGGRKRWEVRVHFLGFDETHSLNISV